MKKTKQDATRMAEKHGCLLDCAYTGAANGWSLSLDAPDGQVFKHSGASCDCDVYGNGLSRNEIDWGLVVSSIERSVSFGFEPE